MNYWILRAINYSIVISVVISFFRLRVIDKQFYPVILFIWLSFLNEIASDITALIFRNNAFTTNVYKLLYTTLLVSQFHFWKVLGSGRRFYILMVSAVFFVWALTNFYFSNLWVFNSYTYLFHFILIVFLSVRLLGKNPFANYGFEMGRVIFLFCLALTIKFASSILVEIFWIYGLTSSDIFLLNIYGIINFVNLVFNILLAIAVFKIPKKREYAWLSRE
ncbi:MAG: hypothetical protein EBV71_07345 [Chitinophagia bacterium]|nr:hypothetical protein [Chitinophagia bacterium]